MTDRTGIINAALLKLGVQTISSEDEQSEAARRAKNAFDRVCRAELRRHRWSFAKTRVSLPALSAAPVFGWVYQYQLPSDCLRVVQVSDYSDHSIIREQTDDIEVPYDIEGETILSNDKPPLSLRYIKDVSATPSVWDDAFADCFAARLALELAPSLVKTDGSVQRMTVQYKDLLREAKRVNAIELPPVPRLDDSWMWARVV